MKLSKHIATILGAGLSVLAVSADAASWRTCSGDKIQWNNDRTNMYINTYSMPVGSSWNNHIQYAMSEWNAVGGSNWRFYVGSDTDGTYSNSNGKNEIYFKYRPSDGDLATTWSRWECYWFFGTHEKYLEADIDFNTRWSWTTGTFDGSNGGSPYSFPLVGLHELGHALGLLHYDGRPDTMNTYYYNGGSVAHYNRVEPHADDRYGLRVLYPDSSTDRDLAVLRFRNTGGGSSTTNKVYTTGGAWTTYIGRNNSYDIYYTVENFGTQTESANVRFYISTNNYISTGDRYIGSTTWSMPTGSYATATKRFTVPGDLAPGVYYIGYIVDPYNSVPESDESNNFVSLVNTVTVY
ncbi:MAG: CARDB domain-containing protein [Gammaproteobacteria bacterium]